MPPGRGEVRQRTCGAAGRRAPRRMHGIRRSAAGRRSGTDASPLPPFRALAHRSPGVETARPCAAFPPSCPCCCSSPRSLRRPRAARAAAGGRRADAAGPSAWTACSTRPTGRAPRPSRASASSRTARARRRRSPPRCACCSTTRTSTSAVRCWNRGPGAIRASLAPRDQILDLDHIGVVLDTYHDRHRAFTFGVNPYGVQFDGIFIGDELDTRVGRRLGRRGHARQRGLDRRAGDPAAHAALPRARRRACGGCGSAARSRRTTRSAPGRSTAQGVAGRRHAAGRRPHRARQACGAAACSTCSPTRPRPGRRARALDAGGAAADVGATSAAPTSGSTRACRSPPRSRSTRR